MKKNFINEKGNPLTLVGIGASAGGFSALKNFFSKIPTNSGMAYVVVIHLSAEAESSLAELLQPHIKIPVLQVTKTTTLKPDHVYVIPPNANLSAIDTRLILTKLEEKRIDRAPIDHFFRTLAKTHDVSAIGVILSGTGSDGTLGIREIKLKNGLTIAQDPIEAEYNGMPQSAIATGMVDRVLPLKEIPPYIIKYKATRPQLKSLFLEPGKEPNADEQQFIQKVLIQVSERTGQDFSRYKMPTLLRRLQRRMQLNQIEKPQNYLNLLRDNPEELDALSDDFLINVTSFFRDTGMFQMLKEKIIPDLFDKKEAGEEFRVWSVGCATGEEAYSLGMLLLEEADARQMAPVIRVFASDLHGPSLSKARKGFFPGDISVDVNKDRLNRFFTQVDRGYRIGNKLRELVVFTRHNVLSDPPFSRIDLILCRNLLIYIKREVQKDISKLLHYALKPNGFLIIGSSENLEGHGLFQLENKEFSIYRKLNVTSPDIRLPIFSTAPAKLEEAQKVEGISEPISYKALHQQVLEKHAPPSILISADYHVMHITRQAGRYFTFMGGELSRNAFRLIRPEIQPVLRSTVSAARKQKKLIRSKPFRVEIEGEQLFLVLTAKIADEPAQGNLILVMFEEYNEPLKPKASPAEAKKEAKDSNQIKDLQQELQESRQHMQEIIEDYESSQEELKASNEELQSSNEELLSTLEELQTGKEELRSMNDELITLDHENRGRVEELAKMSDDLQNLLTSTDIATLFLDKKLQIQLFTPKLSELFNVRSADYGRPITDQTHKLRYNQLEKDCLQVLKSLIPIEREIKDKNGKTFLARIQLYRTAEDRIEGVVITFIDISEIKQAEEATRVSEEKYRTHLEQEILERTAELNGKKELLDATMNSSENMIQVFEAVRGKKREIVDFKWILTNHAAEKKYGMVVGKNLLDVYKSMADSEMFEAFKKVVETGISYQSEENYSNELFKGWSHLSIVKLGDGIATTTADIAKRKKAELELLRLKEEVAKQASDKYLRLFNSIDEGFCIIEVLFDKNEKPYDYRFLEANHSFKKQTGLNNPIGKTAKEMIPGHEKYWFEIYGKIAKTGKAKRFEKEAKAIRHYYDVYAFRVDAPEKNHVAVIFRDIARQKETEKKLRQAKEQAETAARSKEMFLSTMSHEIRTPLNAIIGLSNLLLKKNPRRDQLENINTLKFSSTTLLNLINDILDYNKIEAGKITLKKVDFRLSSFIQKIIETHLVFAKEKNNTLWFKFADNVPDIIRNDPNKLAQVLNNLLSNAIKFTDNGTISLEISVEKEVDNEVWLHFAIKDTGVGIPKEKVGQIFEKFTQIDSSMVRRYGGTGLGLSITKSILQLMGSEIKVESKEGEGSMFHFTIKQELGEEENYPSHENNYSSPEDETQIKSTINLLLVDDSPLNRMVLQQHLEEWWSLQAHEASNGLEAIEKAKQNKYDLILMDIRMPEMDGLEASRRIRKLNAHYAKVPIIVLTADHTLDKKKKVVHDLFNGVITKPFEPEELLLNISPYIPEKGRSHLITKQSSYVSEKSTVDFTPKLSSPDFYRLDNIFRNMEDGKQEFLNIAFSSVQEFQTDFLHALRQGNAEELENVLHKARMVFNTLGVDDLYKKMQEIKQEIEKGASENYPEKVIPEIEYQLNRLIDILQEKLKDQGE